jgi:hypothetical protein
MSTDTPDIDLILDRRATATTTGFFFVAHLVLLVVVLVGFSPTFFLRPLLKDRPLPGVLDLHGAVLTSWFLLTVLQGWLIRTRRLRLHRRIGCYAVASYAAVVVVMGVIADARLAASGEGFEILRSSVA